LEIARKNAKANAEQLMATLPLTFKIAKTAHRRADNLTAESASGHCHRPVTADEMLLKAIAGALNGIGTFGQVR